MRRRVSLFSKRYTTFGSSSVDKKNIVIIEDFYDGKDAGMVYEIARCSKFDSPAESNLRHPFGTPISIFPRRRGKRFRTGPNRKERIELRFAL